MSHTWLPALLLARALTVWSMTPAIQELRVSDCCPHPS